jgi:hypothetical protein
MHVVLKVTAIVQRNIYIKFSGFTCNLEGLNAPIICPKGFWRYNNGFNAVIDIENNVGKLLDFIDSSTDLYKEYLEYYNHKGIGALNITAIRSDYLYTNKNTDCIICPPGYYCPRGSRVPIGCPIGTYCEHQSSEPMVCQKGYYNNKIIQYKCTPCEPGRVCLLDNMNSTIPCPPGYICPTSTIGTLDSNLTIIEFNSAKPCPPSMYCELGTIDSGTLCPIGYYCPKASSTPTPCEPGTFQNKTGMSFCFDCPPGYYCNKPNMTSPTNCDAGRVCNKTALVTPLSPCPEGFICPKKIGEYPGYTSLPVDLPWQYSKPTVCPKGSFCYRGTASEEYQLGDYTTPQPCNIGEYNPFEGKGKCLKCDPGAQCTESGMNSKEPCPKGTYRPDDPGQINCLLCPAGYYGYKEGQADLKGCNKCPAGIVCIAYGLIIDQFSICI